MRKQFVEYQSCKTATKRCSFALESRPWRWHSEDRRQHRPPLPALVNSTRQRGAVDLHPLYKNFSASNFLAMP